MRAHHGDHRDLLAGFHLALDWRKCLLGTLGTLLVAVGLEGVLAAASAGRVHLHHLGQAARHLDWGSRREAAGALAGLAVAGLLAHYVFSFFGAAIARLAALESATGERAPLRAGVGFARRKFRACFWGPLGPLVVAAFFLGLVAAFGLVGRVEWLGLGKTAVALGYVLALGASLVAVVLAVGTAASWSLFASAVAVEGSDNFDAASRCLNYVYTRPGHLILYRLLALAYGLAATAAVAGFALLVWLAAHAAVGLGMGGSHERLVGLLSALASGRPGVGGAAVTPYSVIYAATAAGVASCVAGFAVSWVYSSAVIQYLLLRHQVDRTSLSEVHHEESEREEELGFDALILEDELGPEEGEAEAGEGDKEAARDAGGVAEAHP